MKFILVFISVFLLLSCNTEKENIINNKLIKKEEKIDTNILCKSEEYKVNVFNREWIILEWMNKIEWINELWLEETLLEDNIVLIDENTGKEIDISEDIKKQENSNEIEICDSCLEYHTSTWFFKTNYKELALYNFKNNIEETTIVLEYNNKIKKYIVVEENKDKLNCFLKLWDYKAVSLKGLDIVFIKNFLKQIPNNFDNLEIYLNK